MFIRKFTGSRESKRMEEALKVTLGISGGLLGIIIVYIIWRVLRKLSEQLRVFLVAVVLLALVGVGVLFPERTPILIGMAVTTSFLANPLWPFLAYYMTKVKGFLFITLAGAVKYCRLLENSSRQLAPCLQSLPLAGRNLTEPSHNIMCSVSK